MITFVLRDEAWEGHTEFYQFSRGFRITYHKKSHVLEPLMLHGKEIGDEQEILIAMQKYHYTNFDEFFNVPLDEVKQNMKPRIIATSVNNIVEEYFATHAGLDSHVEGRITLLED
jgi:5'-nucleotidase